MFKTLQSFLNWKDIKQQLHQLAQRKYSPQQIIKLIHNFQYYSQCDQNRAQKKTSLSKCRLLLKLYEKELPQIYSKVANFVLSRPKHTIPLFLQGEDKEHTFTKETVLYLFCSMMLCLTPRQQFDSSVSMRDNFNYLLDFSYIFDEEQFKTRNVIEYIKKQIDNKQAYDEKMTIHRHVQERPIQQIIEENKNRPMGKITVQSDQASIQNFYGELKADFANKYLGGGALLSGCVQEELMFANHPQLFTTQLLCEVMKPNECIFLSGYKKYFNNAGYGWTAAFDGPNKHEYKYDKNKQAQEYITAIDAIHFGRRNEWEQFQPYSINRQLLKAYCGFSFNKAQSNRVITGNWGCGAFGGNLKIKFLIQWLACSALGKQMVYCPFGSRDKVYVQPFLQKFSRLKVGQAYSLVHQACNNLVKQKDHMDIYKAVEELL